MPRPPRPWTNRRKTIRSVIIYLITKKRILIGIGILSAVSLIGYFRLAPIKTYGYVLSPLCYPNMLEYKKDKGPEHIYEDYRVVFGQKDEYDKAVKEIQTRNVNQDIKFMGGCDYSYANYKLYLF